MLQNADSKTSKALPSLAPGIKKQKARLTTKEDAWMPWPTNKVGDGSFASSLVEAENN
jgi:hypothetical protein